LRLGGGCGVLHSIIVSVWGLSVRCGAIGSGGGWGFVLCPLFIVIWWGKFIYILFGCKSVSYIFI